MQEMKDRELMGATLPIEVELRSERASALRHAAKRLEDAARALTEVHRQLAAAPEAERPALRDQARALRQEALTRRWYLVVQREAMGLWNHDDLEVYYPLPPGEGTSGP